jgi:ABC-type multidrug transport system ATPase subunit
MTARLERAWQVAVRRGDRIARVYPLINGRRAASNGSGTKPSTTASVTENECRTLLGAGATWAGRADQAPASRPFLERIRVRNFRCVHQLEFPLTPLHALIGPNDSGKSTLLQALQGFSDERLGEAEQITVFSGERALTNMRGSLLGHPAHLDLAQAAAIGEAQGPGELMGNISHPSRLLRLDPDAMRQPTSLIPQGHPLQYGPRGDGLAAVYDAFLSRRLDVFLDINKRFVALFPTARSIQLTNASQTTKALGVELHDGRSVGPGQLSEGMLYWLAFAALPYLQPAPVILIEEPENGLHPSRIGEVMGVLRRVSQTSQILLATHHPLVINELQPDEVTIITRTPERGTIATPLSETKNFEQRAKVYELGELWLNYADGEFEQDLVQNTPSPTVQ